MENLDLYLKNLTGKDENKAQNVANYLVNHADLELFKMLVIKTDYLFDFVRNNVEKRIEKAVSKDNFMNIINFFEIYSTYYDDLFASILAKHANEDVTDEIFELLEKGTDAQKTYAAKYFYYIPDTVALELLLKYAFSENEYLSYNSAQALGQMQDDVSYSEALGYLNSDDDFEKLAAVKFFVAYAKNPPIKEIINSLKISKMPENIAGQIPYMISLLSLLKSNFKEDSLIILDYILSGLGEILPLSDIFQFELYDVLDYLINEYNSFDSKVSEVLLSAYSKFQLFNENQEYVFDEDKDTKNEVSAIWSLLNSLKDEFWNEQKQNVINELTCSDDRILAVLRVIDEFSLINSVDKLKILLNSSNEIIISEVLSLLYKFNSIENIDISAVESKIQNPNIKAIINNLQKY